MNEKDRIKIVSGLDIPVAIFLLITGILVTILAIDMIGLMLAIPSYANVPLYYNTLPWIFLMLGLGALIYGIKRTIDNILKIMIIGKQMRQQPPRYQSPVNQTRQVPPGRQF